MTTLHFDPTITLGTVIQLGSLLTVLITMFISARRTVRNELAAFKMTLNEHGLTMATHSRELTRVEHAIQARIEQQDDRMEQFTTSVNRLTGQVQWIIGRIEIPERRSRSGQTSDRGRP